MKEEIIGQRTPTYQKDAFIISHGVQLSFGYPIRMLRFVEEEICQKTFLMIFYDMDIPVYFLQRVDPIHSPSYYRITGRFSRSYFSAARPDDEKQWEACIWEVPCRSFGGTPRELFPVRTRKRG